MNLEVPIALISFSPALNASLFRYYKYIHHQNLSTITFDKGIPHRHHILFVINEAQACDEVVGIYPFWEAWGEEHDSIVYALSYGCSDFKNNLFNWEDFIGLKWQGHSKKPVRYDDIPHFDAAASLIRRVLKPHCGDSLFDMAARLYSSFVGITRRLKGENISERVLKAVKALFIEKGWRVFAEFHEAVMEYREFLILLPGGHRFFIDYSSLENILSEVVRDGDYLETNPAKAVELLSRLEPNVKRIYNFFACLEQYVKKGEK